MNGSAPVWQGRVYLDARYASGRFYGSLRWRPDPPVPGRVAKDPELSRANAASRARQKVMLYASSNRLNRLATLTYAPPFCTDAAQLREDLAAFFKGLRQDLGGKPIPYVWVPEFHADGQRFHAHFAVNRFIRKSLIDSNWTHGYSSIKLLGNVPSGDRALGEARAAAKYLSKYISKTFDASRMGLHRYEVAQGFQPRYQLIAARTQMGWVMRAIDVLGNDIEESWTSDESANWPGPPAITMRWRP